MREQAFWIAQGKDIFKATILTQGPWDPHFQHGGPPAALLVRQMEHCSPQADMVLSRLTVDILGPVPIATFHAHAHIIRPGRNVELLEAFLEQEDRTLMHATGWRIRAASERPAATEREFAPDIPQQETPPITDPAWKCGYLDGTEWRFARGGFLMPGPATAWSRLRYPLVAGEETSPVQRLTVVADAANGISSPLDIREWQFVPPGLTIHMVRPPASEWICLDAVTHIQPEGTGLTLTTIYDRQGMVGHAAQSLFISRRM
jgi:hypothetical protein